MSTDARSAEAGELCTCGRQAATVFPSPHRPGRVVGYCGLPDGGAVGGPDCPWCADWASHGPKPCPAYTLRPAGAGDPASS